VKKQSSEFRVRDAPCPVRGFVPRGVDRERSMAICTHFLTKSGRWLRGKELSFEVVNSTSDHDASIFPVVFEILKVVDVALMNLSLSFRPKPSGYKATLHLPNHRGASCPNSQPLVSRRTVHQNFSNCFHISRCCGLGQAALQLQRQSASTLANACNRWLSGPGKVYIVGPVTRSDSDQHHSTPRPEVPARVD